MQKDSVVGTLVVAAGLCIACSVLVSSAAVSLKPLQDANKVLDVKKNILLASGLIDSSASKEDILSAYQQIQAEVIDLETGEVQTEINAETFDQRKARKDTNTNVVIPKDRDTAGIKLRSKFSIVYKVIKDNTVDMLIFPINGKGLWSTLYGFIALSNDLKEIKGIGFYEHGETPGLGGEVDNANWKAQWKGKKAFGEDLKPKIALIKGSVPESDPAKDYKIDGLSGATITANGVTGLVQYWLGDHGFGAYITKYRAGLANKGGE